MAPVPVDAGIMLDDEEGVCGKYRSVGLTDFHFISRSLVCNL